MTTSGRTALLLVATLVGAGLAAATPTAATPTAAASSPLPALSGIAAAATTGCAAKAVAVADATTYGATLAPRSLVGVASYNIEGQYASGWSNWPGRRNAVATQIANCLPDVIGLQEAAQSPVWEQRGIVSSKRLISQYEDLTDEINERTTAGGDVYIPTNRYRSYCSRIPDWNGQWQGRPAEWRRCLENEPKGSNDNRILYNSRTVRLLSQGFGNLTSDAGGRRTVAWAVLQQTSTGRRFFVADTHLSVGVTEAFKVTQMKQVLAVVTARRVYGGVRLPTFVVGDLNVSRYTEGRTAADTLTTAGYVDIVGNDRRLKASRLAVGWCRRLPPAPASVPMAASRFVNVVFNTFSASTYSCAYPEGHTEKPRLAPSSWWKYNGSAIDYIWVSPTVRARTWETVVPAGSTNGFALKPPSDHNMIMTWTYA